MSSRSQAQVFKAGSTTYFNSSLFFPPAMRTEVFTLYGFVRVADNFVDAFPQQTEDFTRFAAAYRAAWAGTPAGDPIIDDFVALARRLDFDPAWTDAFLVSMAADLSTRFYRTEEETLRYIYGSAEVIGLFMARIMRLPEESWHAARRLGRAMQYINFIRDVAEDAAMGRRYLPLERGGTRLLDVPDEWRPDRTWAEANPGVWVAFLQEHLKRYAAWQAEAEAGYRFIPRRPRTAVRTAGDMYNWTARQIARDPLRVFVCKIKPARPRILLQALCNALWG
ncbi:MAG TPA: phytoene/squalene synthase family protein [Kiritimatiellia bacterium]|nr:phytoene/squalene synthase family protein [Kiritimatiellia bacterium]